MRYKTTGHLFNSLTHCQVNEAKFFLKTFEGFWSLGFAQARLLNASLSKPSVSAAQNSAPMPRSESAEPFDFESVSNQDNSESP